MAVNALDEKINKIKLKNEEIKRRHEEVEADKKNAAKLNALVQLVPSNDWPERKEPPEFSAPPKNINSVVQKQKLSNKEQSDRLPQRSSGIQDRLAKKDHKFTQGDGPPPDPKYNFLADSEREIRNTNNIKTDDDKNRSRNKSARGASRKRGGGEGRGNGGGSRDAFFKDNRGPHAFHSQGEGLPEYEAWRAERNRIDEARINRQKTAEGNWRREWDCNKMNVEKDSSRKGDFTRKDSNNYERRSNPYDNEHSNRGQGGNRTYHGSQKNHGQDYRRAYHDQTLEYNKREHENKPPLSPTDDRTVTATDKSIKVTLGHGNQLKGPVMSVKVNSPSIAGTGRVGPRQKSRVTYSSQSDTDVISKEINDFSRQKSFDEKTAISNFNGGQKALPKSPFLQRKKENSSKSPHPQRKEFKNNEISARSKNPTKSSHSHKNDSKDKKQPTYSTPKTQRVQKRNQQTDNSENFFIPDDAIPCEYNPDRPFLDISNNSGDSIFVCEPSDESLCNESIIKLDEGSIDTMYSIHEQINEIENTAESHDILENNVLEISNSSTVPQDNNVENTTEKLVSTSQQEFTENVVHANDICISNQEKVLEISSELKVVKENYNYQNNYNESAETDEGFSDISKNFGDSSFVLEPSNESLCSESMIKLDQSGIDTIYNIHEQINQIQNTAESHDVLEKNTIEISDSTKNSQDNSGENTVEKLICTSEQESSENLVDINNICINNQEQVPETSSEQKVAKENYNYQNNYNESAETDEGFLDISKNFSDSTFVLEPTNEILCGESMIKLDDSGLDTICNVHEQINEIQKAAESDGVLEKNIIEISDSTKISQNNSEENNVEKLISTSEQEFSENLVHKNNICINNQEQIPEISSEQKNANENYESTEADEGFLDSSKNLGDSIIGLEPFDKSLCNEIIGTLDQGIENSYSIHEEISEIQSTEAPPDILEKNVTEISDLWKTSQEIIQNLIPANEFYTNKPEKLSEQIPAVNEVILLSIPSNTEQLVPDKDVENNINVIETNREIDLSLDNTEKEIQKITKQEIQESEKNCENNMTEINDKTILHKNMNDQSNIINSVKNNNEAAEKLGTVINESICLEEHKKIELNLENNLCNDSGFKVLPISNNSIEKDKMVLGEVALDKSVNDCNDPVEKSNVENHDEKSSSQSGETNIYYKTKEICEKSSEICDIHSAASGKEIPDTNNDRHQENNGLENSTKDIEKTMGNINNKNLEPFNLVELQKITSEESITTVENSEQEKSIKAGDEESTEK